MTHRTLPTESNNRERFPERLSPPIVRHQIILKAVQEADNEVRAMRNATKTQPDMIAKLGLHLYRSKAPGQAVVNHEVNMPNLQPEPEQLKTIDIDKKVTNLDESYIALLESVNNQAISSEETTRDIQETHR